MKTLYITDLDGTFLNSEVKISSVSSEIINSLADKGLCFSVATARTYATVLGLFENVKLTAPIVLMNGVMIYDTAEKRVVKAHCLTAEQGRKILDIYAEAGIFPLTYFLSEDDKIDIYYKDLTNEYISEYVNQRNRNSIKRFHQIFEDIDLENGRLVYMTSMDSYDILQEVCEKISKILGVGYTFCKDNYSNCYFLETFAAAASKASGTLEIKELVKADKIIAFGDNLNDIPLFEVADECYAVSNSAEALKNIATGIIPSNDEDAVAKFILERFRS